MATSEGAIAAALEQLSGALGQIRSDTVGRIDRLEHSVAELDSIWRKQSGLLSEAMRKSELAGLQQAGYQRDSQRRDEDTQRKVALLEEEFLQLRNRLPSMEPRISEIERGGGEGTPRHREERVLKRLDAFASDSSPQPEDLESALGVDGPSVCGEKDRWAGVPWAPSQPDVAPALSGSTGGGFAASARHDREQDLDPGMFRAGRERGAADPGRVFAPADLGMAAATHDTPKGRYLFWVLGALLGVTVLASALVSGKREKDAATVGANFSDMRTLSLPEPAARDPNDTLFVVEIPRIDQWPADSQASYSPPGEHGAISEKALRDMAKNGNPKANTILGLRALDDRGAAPVSLPEAVHYLKRAAEGGNPIAQFRLASLYEHGDGVSTDLANAKHWYALAANQGNRKAMHNLAVFYSSGAAGGKDLQQAAYWFAEAASLGVTDSQFNLAFLYEHGYGMTKNLVEASKWYSIAARSGDEESKKRAGLLKGQLSAAERVAVSRAARDFRAMPFDPAANVPPDASSL